MKNARCGLNFLFRLTRELFAAYFHSQPLPKTHRVKTSDDWRVATISFRYSDRKRATVVSVIPFLSLSNAVQMNETIHQLKLRK